MQIVEIASLSVRTKSLIGLFIQRIKERPIASMVGSRAASKDEAKAIC
jgi:hypothetical protein